MEIYKNNLEYAKKNGEREQYLQSLELCDKCGAFIRHSIAVNFNFTTKYLDVKTITAEVTEKYGFERTMLMLALRVDSLKNDGRVDIANKEWAKKYLVNYPNAEELRRIADRTLESAHPVLLDNVAEEVRFNFMEMNRSKEREVEGYRIIQTVKTPYAEFLLSQSNLLSAYHDLYSRALSDVNHHTRFEEPAPKIGSIIRTVNGQNMQFELTDEERNGVWNMVEQQNVESHFKELLSERGVLPDWSGMESIITDMAEKYRDDFGYGYDEDMQGYIDDHEDEIKEITDKYLYGDIYVDKGNISDFTGRIMIVRPEHINSRDVIPENQLFLAQEGPGCNPEDYGSEINGIFLYEREEASLTNDCFLGAMREEHIPEWANEAREDIAEESSDEEADDEYEPEM
ncbi:MAG: DUF3849 domain-containing protein [Oscillospiraceae bacterium]